MLIGTPLVDVRLEGEFCIGHSQCACRGIRHGLQMFHMDVNAFGMGCHDFVELCMKDRDGYLIEVSEEHEVSRPIDRVQDRVERDLLWDDTNPNVQLLLCSWREFDSQGRRVKIIVGLSVNPYF